MSYNEEGLIRVKRADNSNGKNLEEEVDSVTTATPIEESIQPVETRSIILLEMPWILPGSSRVGEIVNFAEVQNILQNYNINNNPGFSYRDPDPEISEVLDCAHSLIKDINHGEEDAWAMESSQAWWVLHSYKFINSDTQAPLESYRSRLDETLARHNVNDHDRDIVMRYYKPFDDNTTKKIQLTFLIYRALRALEIEHVIQDFLGNAMPVVTAALRLPQPIIAIIDGSTPKAETPQLPNYIIGNIRGMILTGFVSDSLSESPSFSASLILYQEYMRSVYEGLRNELDCLSFEGTDGDVSPDEDSNASKSDYMKVIIRSPPPHEITMPTTTLFHEYQDHIDDVPISPSIGGLLFDLAMLIRARHDRLERAIAQSRKESDALCAQLEEHDEQLIGAEGLRAEINIILNGYEIDVVSPIVSGFGLNSKQHKNAIRERTALEQIIRDLNSQDKVIVQQAMNNAQHNKTVQQMLADKKLVLITPTCKPFKDSHNKKDDHDDSNGGHGGCAKKSV